MLFLVMVFMPQITTSHECFDIGVVLLLVVLCKLCYVTNILDVELSVDE